VAVVVAVIALALPLALQSRLTERDLRIRNHNGALSRFYLDAMLGLAPIRAHGAERAARREHESLVVEWMRASYDYLRAVVAVETTQSLIGFGLAAWLLFDHLSIWGSKPEATLRLLGRRARGNLRLSVCCLGGIGRLRGAWLLTASS